MWSECFYLCLRFFLLPENWFSSNLSDVARGCCQLVELFHPCTAFLNSSTLNLKVPRWFENLISFLLMQHIRDSEWTHIKFLACALCFIIPQWINGFHMFWAVWERSVTGRSCQRAPWDIIFPNFPFFGKMDFQLSWIWHVACVAPRDVGAWSRGGSVDVNKIFGKRFRSGY